MVRRLTFPEMSAHDMTAALETYGLTWSEADELMEFPDLVDAAIASASTMLQIAYGSRYCYAIAHDELEVRT